MAFVLLNNKQIKINSQENAVALNYDGECVNRDMGAISTHSVVKTFNIQGALFLWLDVHRSAGR